MKKKELLIICLLAVLVTKLSVASPFSGLVVFQLPSNLLRRLLLHLLSILIGPLPLLFQRPWLLKLEMLAVLIHLFLLFLFWFLVLAVGWWAVKWVWQKPSSI